MKRQRLFVVSAFGISQPDGDVSHLFQSFQIDPHHRRRSQDDGPRPDDIPPPLGTVIIDSLTPSSRKMSIQQSMYISTSQMQMTYEVELDIQVKEAAGGWVSTEAAATSFRVTRPTRAVTNVDWSDSRAFILYSSNVDCSWNGEIKKKGGGGCVTPKRGKKKTV